MSYRGHVLRVTETSVCFAGSESYIVLHILNFLSTNKGLFTLLAYYHSMGKHLSKDGAILGLNKVNLNFFQNSFVSIISSCQNWQLL